jgi:hypothetical protein
MLADDLKTLLATTTGSGSVATVSTTLGEPITRDSFSNKEQKEKYGNSANMAEYKPATKK